MNLETTIQIYGGGPGSGPRPGLGKLAKESKTDALARLAKQYPEVANYPGVLLRHYREEQFGNLKTLQGLAKASNTQWEPSKVWSIGTAHGITYSKDLGRGKGQVQVKVLESQPYADTGRPTVHIEVEHRMPSEPATKILKTEDFTWDSRHGQAANYLSSYWGIHNHQAFT